MLGLIKLFKMLRRLRVQRKEHYIKREVKFSVDTNDYLFCFLPTIVFSPWPFRYNGEAIFDIQWLHMHITIGRWGRIQKYTNAEEDKYYVPSDI